MKSVESEDGKKAGADGEETNESSEPEILAKGKFCRQAVLSPLAVLDPAHDQCGDAGEEKNRPVAEGSHSG